jgi:hypothetical protein
MEGYPRLTEKLLCEQRRNLVWLPDTGEVDRSPRLPRGQRTRSTRRRHARPGRQRKAATGGRGLDIPGMPKSDGQQEAATTQGE